MTPIQDLGKHLLSQKKVRPSCLTTVILTAGAHIAASGRSNIPLRADPMTDLFHVDFEIPGSVTLNRQACANMIRVSQEEMKVAKSEEFGNIAN